MAYAMTKQGSLTNFITYEFICDTVADMNAIETEYRTLGSVAIVLAGESGMEVYMAGSDKEWNSLTSLGGNAAPPGLTIYICGQNEVSNGLPDVEEPDDTTLYLIPAQNETNNLYEEYVWVNDGWEKFGGATLDLSGYATLQDIAGFYTKPNGGIPATDLAETYLTQHQDISNLATKSEIPDVYGFYTKPAGGIPATDLAETYLTQHQSLDSYAPKANPVFTGSVSMGRNANSSVGTNSTALGFNVTASGQQSHAEGNSTTASGINSHVEGNRTTASSYNSHAEGSSTTASGNQAHTEGTDTVASGINSHAEGSSTTASDSQSHAEGSGNKTATKTINGTTYTGSGAHGVSSHAEGNLTWAIGINSHAEGTVTTASGPYSHAEGSNTTASSFYAHSEGSNTTASGPSSHAEGDTTTASGTRSHAEGYKATASGESSHAEGQGGTYTSDGTTYTSEAKGTADHTEGYQTRTANGQPGNHAEGYRTAATGGAAHAEGAQTLASGIQSHSEGANTIASGMQSHAEGYITTASGTGSHAEGERTIASSFHAHAEGFQTTASSSQAHAEGVATIASGAQSHAEGSSTTASGDRTHVQGSFNAALEKYPAWTADTSYVIGDKVSGQYGRGYKCIVANSDATFTAANWELLPGNTDEQFVIGNGIASNARSNAFVVNWDGTVKTAGDVYVHCNNDSTGGTKLATETFVNTAVGAIDLSPYATVAALNALTQRVAELESEITSLRNALNLLNVPENVVTGADGTPVTDEALNYVEFDEPTT